VQTGTTPLAAPKVSHASQSGSTEKPAKYPNPAMAWCGAFNLKKNGAPKANRCARADGRQKFASLGPGSRDSCSHQPGSVTAK
jgi:hypothetical protein